jgi:ABC-2 type transport system permease protein
MSTVEPLERPLGHRIPGPSAFGEDPRRFLRLSWVIASTDFKLKFFGSALGYLWQVMKPLLLFGVLFVVFTQVVDLGEGVRFYATALLLGIVLFSFLREMTSGATRILVDREALVRKVAFPRLALPVAVIITAVLNLLLNLIAVVVFLFVEGGRPQVDWLQMPVILGALTFLGLGLSMLLSAAFVRYRDVDPIWDVILQALFYASPIFYPVQIITGANADLIVRLLLFNPFATLVQQSRHAFIDPSHPSAATAMGGVEWLAVPGGITLAVFVWGFLTFRRMAPKVAELL